MKFPRIFQFAIFLTILIWISETSMIFTCPRDYSLFISVTDIQWRGGIYIIFKFFIGK